MITFKQYLSEFRSNIPQGQMLEKEFFVDLINQSKLLKWTIFIRQDENTEKDIVVFEYNNSQYDKFIILCDRKNNTDIVGYAWLNNKDFKQLYWQIKDVGIYPEYRNKGIGTNLYIKLAKEGYNLVNGYSLSKEIEKVWRKLPEYVNVYTLDISNFELSPMDERPKQDNKWDDKQQYFWVAIAKQDQLKESEWHSENDFWFNEWINGKFSPSFGSEWFEGEY